MFGFLKKKLHEVSAEEIIEHLKILQRSEDEIQELYELGDTINIIKKAKQREEIAKKLTELIKQIEKDINAKTKGNGVINKENFETIKKMLQNIEQILIQQLKELNQEEILENSLARICAINGDNFSTKSTLTKNIKEVTDLLNSQSKILANYIIETESSLRKIIASLILSAAIIVNVPGCTPPNSIIEYSNPISITGKVIKKEYQAPLYRNPSINQANIKRFSDPITFDLTQTNIPEEYNVYIETPNGTFRVNDEALYKSTNLNSQLYVSVKGKTIKTFTNPTKEKIKSENFSGYEFISAKIKTS